MRHQLIAHNVAKANCYSVSPGLEKFSMPAIVIPIASLQLISNPLPESARIATIHC
jgi:hypothetical protein